MANEALRENTMHPEIMAVYEKIELIKRLGFGEVRVQIRNGAVYRIITTEEIMLPKQE